MKIDVIETYEIDEKKLIKQPKQENGVSDRYLSFVFENIIARFACQDIPSILCNPENSLPCS